MLEDRYKVLGVACAAGLVDSLGYGIVIPSIPLYAQSLGATEGQIGSVYAVTMFMFMVTILPLGIVVDHYGKKPMVLIGLAFLVASFILYASANSLTLLVISGLLRGLSSACIWAGAVPLAAQAALEGKRGLEMSALTITYAIGVIFGPVMGSIGSFQTPYLIMAVFTAPLLILTLIYLKEPSIEKTFGAQNLGRQFIRVLGHANVQVASIALVITFFSVGMLEVFFPLHITGLGYPRIYFGLLYGFVFGSFNAIAQPLVGGLSDSRVKRTLFLVPGILIAAFLFPLPFFFSSFAAWIPLAAILGFMVAGIYVLGYPIIADGVNPQEQGMAYGVCNMVYALGHWLGPTLGGKIAEITSSIITPFYCSSTILVLGALIIILLSRRRSFVSCIPAPPVNGT